MDMKIVEETMGASYDQLFVIRGPRSKRPRPPSLTSSSSIGGSSGGVHGEGEAEDGVGVYIHGHDQGYDGSSSSAAMSTIEFFKNTEEEEDMANCLILLAQGSKTSEHRQTRRKTVETIELREGLSMYECKTCNRSFGSFQALGGHRASHRKPKAIIPMISEEKKALHPEAQLGTNKITSSDQVFPSDARMGNKVVHMNNNKPKVHECSICGADFSSGQALGGHMRRHRNTTPVAMAMKKENSSENPRRNVFSLDLNLPAPEEDVEVLENNDFTRLPEHFIFSGSALVDCHY